MSVMKLGIAFFLSIVIGALGYLSGKKFWSSTDKYPIIQSYSVPSLQAEAIRDSLRALLGDPSAAHLIEDHLLVVKASERQQMGISQILSQATQEKNHRIRLNYWVVRAEAAKVSNAHLFPQLESLFNQMNLTNGLKKFYILEPIELLFPENGKASIEGMMVNLNSQVTSVGGEMDLLLSVSFHWEVHGDRFSGIKKSGFQTQLRVKPGEVVVAAQTGGVSPHLIGKGTSPVYPDSLQVGEIYHIVQVESLP